MRGDGEGDEGGCHGEAPTTDNSQSVVAHSTGSVTVPKGTSEGGWTSPSVSCSHSEPTQKLRAYVHWTATCVGGAVPPTSCTCAEQNATTGTPWTTAHSPPTTPDHTYPEQLTIFDLKMSKRPARWAQGGGVWQRCTVS